MNSFSIIGPTSPPIATSGFPVTYADATLFEGIFHIIKLNEPSTWNPALVEVDIVISTVPHPELPLERHRFVRSSAVAATPFASSTFHFQQND